MTDISELEERLRRLEFKMGKLSTPVGINKKITTIEAQLSKLSGLVRPWKAWIPTFTGFSTNPSGVTARYCLVGKLCHATVHMGTAGTSNANNFTVSVPFTGSSGNLAYASIPYLVDNGVAYVSDGFVSVFLGGTVFNLWHNGYTGWATSGNKRAYFEIFYEVA